ncbi:MAG: asparagine synthase-related protein [Telluria sp.]|nr:asparagine synthase-related protein [Telluria sp.]
MSGLCGWFSAAPGLVPISQMAAPLWRFDNAPLRTGANGAGAVALAAWPDCATLYHEDGLLIALWGRRVDGLGQLWRSQGVQACAALSGAFALAVLDERNNEALLAIDRSGTRALSYQLVGRTLAFASSADALVQHPLASREISPQAIHDYLYFHTVPSPESVYRGQRRLQPGQFVHLCRGRLETGSYWKLQFRERETRPFAELKDDFVGAVRGAVQASLGQQEVGAFLSGGTDSSTITAMLGQVTGSAARTYSIGFQAPGYDELDYARLVARHFGSAHHERYVSAHDVAEAVPKIAAVFDQPFGNASAVPSFYCAEMARDDGVQRLLGGDGGDELFGGNERYARQALFSRYHSIPAPLRRALIEPLLFRFARGSQMALLRKARSYVEQAMVPLPARLETYNLLQCYGAASVLDPAFLASVDPDAPLAALTRTYCLMSGHTQINQMLALDMKYTLADNDLPKVIKACELAGVDAAFPFLDDAVVAFAARLRPRHKLRGTRLRYFFKEALRDTLPRAVIGKKKHGFGLPFGFWLQGDARLRALALDSLSDLKARHIVRADFIDSLLAQRVSEHPAYHGTMVWVLMMLEQWFAQRKPGGSVSPSPPRTGHESRTCRQ